MRRGGVAALLAGLLAAAPALAGSGVEGDAATSAPETPPAPWAAPIDPAAGAAVFDRCAAATYVWLQVRPETVPADEARFVHEAFLVALLDDAHAGRAADETDEAVRRRAQDALGLAVQRYLASFKAPAYGGGAEGLLAEDLGACRSVLEAEAAAARDG